MEQKIMKRMAMVCVGLMLAILMGSAAVAQDVTTNSMPGIDFTKYHTYKWVVIEGAEVPIRSSTRRLNRQLTRNWQPRD